jgi:hypothetical protein
MKIKTILLLTTAQVFCTAIASDFSFSEAMSPGNGTTTLDTRTFYFDRSFDKPDTDDAEAFTLGGILKYESGDYKSFGFGLAYYGSHSLFGIVDRDKGGGTALLQIDGDDISLLGEAYIDLDSGTNQVKLGRQRLTTPLMDDHDLRMVPTAYEAAVYRNKSFEDTILEVGYVSAFTGFGSSLGDFESPDEVWGEDGLAYVYAKSNMGPVSVRAQFIGTLEDSGTYENYGYLDGKLPIEAGNKSYLSGQFAHTGHQTEPSSKVLGLKTGTSVSSVDLAFILVAIRDNRFKAVEAGPLYTEWQQGYGTYEPSDAVAVQVTFHPMERSSILLGYADVESRDGDVFNTDTYTEFNLDAQYTINDASKIRLRYSDKNQDEDSDREDRQDFRIIYYYNFH